MKSNKRKNGVGKEVFQKASLYACLTLFAGTAFPMPSWASSTVTEVTQQSSKQITGTVVDVEGNPIIGANVLQAGTTNGTITDVDGRFTLHVPVGKTVIVSYIGFHSQTVTVGSSNDYRIVIKEDSEALDEVVVVGYGTQKKVNLTGSVATISADKLANRTSSNVTNMLAGQMPGVTIIQTSGQPGADAGVLRVRGIGTMGDASAMVIIDGVESSMSSVDPNDIESISVLKDAAASAIYGVRAANGVVLITTKKGAKGRAEVSYDGYVGWQNATRLPKFLDSYNYALLMNEAYTNDGQTAPYSEADLAKFKNGTDPDYYPNSDWMNALLSEDGLFHNHHLSIKGGSDKVIYSAAFGYHSKDGLMPNTSYNKFSARLNLEAKINKRLKMTSGIALYRSNRLAPAEGVSNLIHYAYRETPVTPIQLSNGRWTLFKNEHNSVASARDGGYSKSIANDFQGNVGMELDIIDGLKLRGIAATSFNLTESPTHAYTVKFYQAGSDTPVKSTVNSLTEYDGKSIELNLQAYLDYSKTFGKYHVGGLLGYSQIYNQQRYLQAYRKNLPTSNTLHQINAGEATGQTTAGSEWEYALRSVFGRVNYAYDDRYLFEANLRYDGTSRFPKNKRFGAFPSFSLGWRVSEEDFFQVNWIDNLKLRLSWGLLGNQETVDTGGYTTYYPYQTTYEFGYDAIFGNAITPGLSISSVMANENITWEKTAQWNVGVDAAFLGNRLTLGFDWFRKETRDILLQLPVPSMLGVSAPMQNAGKVRNTGVEIQLGHNNKIGDWSYNVGASFSYVSTKIIDLKGGDTPGRSVGDPLWTYYGYVCDGIFQTQEEINNHAVQKTGTPVPGDLKYRDLNGDNVVDSNDRKVLGSYFPKVNFGLNLSLAYKGFDMSALVQGAADVKGKCVSEVAYAFYNGGKVNEMHLNRWTPNNPNATYPRLSMSDSRNRVTSSFWIQNAAYAKLRNLQVGYTLPMNMTKKFGVSRLRLYCTMDNLLTITGFDGVDPEAVNGNYYPLTKSYAFGLNVTF